MLRLSAGGPVCVNGRASGERASGERMSGVTYVTCYQDGSYLGSTLSRCCVFRQVVL